jgi:hypothetical protein
MDEDPYETINIHDVSEANTQTARYAARRS